MDTQPPKSNNFLVILLSILLLSAVSIAGFFVFQTQRLAKQLAQYQSASPSPAGTPVKEDDETTDSSRDEVLRDWKTYTNKEIGFEFSYPDTYQVLTDKENLYGWPKAILLLYKGGQSYDMAVEVWNTESEYKSKYTGDENLTIKKVDNKFITLLNTNKDSEVGQIISTFKFTEENQTKIDCKDPRPEVCTLECIQNPPYICGSDGKSYCTVCQACANKDVAWYEMKPSPCEEFTD